MRKHEEILYKVETYPPGAMVVYHLKTKQEANSLRTSLYRELLKTGLKCLTISRVKTKNFWNVIIKRGTDND